MWMTPEFRKAQENMQPGVITADGFLGDETRPIIEIISADEERMAQLGIEFEEAAARMRRVIDEGRKGLGEPITVDGKWVVRVDEARGFLASPFEDGIFRKVNAVVSRKEDPERQLLVSELSLHLFEKYHFCQGKGSPFRLDPDRLRQVLDL